MTHSATIIRVPRLRRMSLRVKPEGEIVVRAPMRTSDRIIEDFIQKNTEWIAKQKKSQQGMRLLTKEELQILKEKAQAYLPQRVQFLADKLWFQYKSVSFRHQKSRWGSCSSKNTISLNIELMRLPRQLCDYIIVHELTHTVHKHHQSGFWNHLESVLPGALDLDREMRRYKIGYGEVDSK